MVFVCDVVVVCVFSLFCHSVLFVHMLYFICSCALFHFLVMSRSDGVYSRNNVMFRF